jgi:hypothetical protein
MRSCHKAGGMRGCEDARRMSRVKGGRAWDAAASQGTG